MEIRLAPPTQEGYQRFEVIGDVTAASWASQPADPFASHGAGVYSQPTLVDMRKATHVDSTGIEWLLTSHRRFLQHGGRMVLHSVAPATQRIFAMMRMQLVLLLAQNEEAAKPLLAKDTP